MRAPAVSVKPATATPASSADDRAPSPVLFGGVVVKRPYYHCVNCHAGACPWDHQLGLSDRMLTPAVAEVSSLAGVSSSFAKAAELMLRRMTGLQISESTVQRTTEDAGTRVGQVLGRRIGLGEAGENAVPIEGRMAYVASIYNPSSEHDERRPKPHQVRYLSGFYDLGELGIQLRKQTGQVGWDQAEQQIGISDGCNGMEQFIRRNFPPAEIIIDFWHVKEHLLEFGKVLFDDDSRSAWMTEMCHKLKHEGGSTVLTSLEEIDPGNSPATKELHRETVQYFANHRHKMDYPKYVARGWQIGSGPIESACRTVVGDRLKGSGMRWGDDGADALCHFRALFLSEPDQWPHFWNAHRN